MNFECHITVPRSHSAVAAQVAAASDPWRTWKTSEIARDPLLGEDTFFYLTCHAKDFEQILNSMRVCVDRLRMNKVPVLREKIELIMHDVRYA